jgi:RNA polymerase sigma-70 factor (ECF subfamily)
MVKMNGEPDPQAMNAKPEKPVRQPEIKDSSEKEIQDWRSVVDGEKRPSQDSSSTATSWTLIQDAANTKSPTTVTSRDELMKRYWSAVFAYIRSSGRSEQKAEDLTQGFFCDVVIGRDLFDRADSTRGRFRSLLMSAVRNYLADDYRMQNAKRRSPGSNAIRRIDDENSGIEPKSSETDPESAFNIRWVDELINRTSDQVREQLLGEGKVMHWDIFQNRILKPCLTGAAPTPHEELAEKWGLRGLPQVSNLLVSAKRSFAKMLLDNVRATLPKGASASNELNELFNALGMRK